MPRYRTRPRTVDAIQYTGNVDAVRAFMGGGQHARVEEATLSGPGRGLTAGIRITMLAATLDVRDGQWIVRHSAGDQVTYEVMWDDVFAKAYELDGG